MTDYNNRQQIFNKKKLKITLLKIWMNYLFYNSKFNIIELGVQVFYLRYEK